MLETRAPEVEFENQSVDTAIGMRCEEAGCYRVLAYCADNDLWILSRPTETLEGELQAEKQGSLSLSHQVPEFVGMEDGIIERIIQSTSELLASVFEDNHGFEPLDSEELAEALADVVTAAALRTLKDTLDPSMHDDLNLELSEPEIDSRLEDVLAPEHRAAVILAANAESFVPSFVSCLRWDPTRDVPERHTVQNEILGTIEDSSETLVLREDMRATSESIFYEDGMDHLKDVVRRSVSRDTPDYPRCDTEGEITESILYHAVCEFLEQNSPSEDFRPRFRSRFSFGSKGETLSPTVE